MGRKNPFYVDIQSRQDQVTGSGNLVTVTCPDGKKDIILVDFGMFQGSDEQNKKNSELKFNPSNLSGIILTHAHVDHCGRIPMLYRYGAYCKTFMTEDTLKISDVMLKDTAAIIQDSHQHDKIYSLEDLEKTLKNFRFCDYEDEVRINDNIKFRLIGNAHIAGAALVYMQVSFPGQEDINILYSGDYKEEDIFLEPTIIPREILEEPVIMLLESTYGEKDRQNEKGKFRSEVSEELQNGKTVVIPVFAFGRAQRILCELKDMQDEGILDVNIPIYLDGGMAINITNKWPHLKSVRDEMKEFLPRNLNYVLDPMQRKYIKGDGKQKIIVTTSGMCNFGPARDYIPHFISDNNAVIYLTGYSSPDSTARKILEADIGELITVAGVIRKKGANVLVTSEFSSHAQQSELVEFVKKFKKINLLILNHGEETAKTNLGNLCTGLENVKDVGIIDGSTDFRFNRYGLIKTLKM